MTKKARRVALLSQKGGAGKTTMTMQLAAELARRGYKVGVADLDPQESATRWAQSAAAGSPFPAAVQGFSGDADAIAKAIDAFATGLDILLIDCPPSIEHPHVAAALARAHVALVPVVPSPPDLWSARAVERLVLQAMRKRPKLSGAIVVNRAQRTALSSSVIQLLREFELPVLRVGLSQRNAFAQSAAVGGSVLDLGKAAEIAQQEVAGVTDALLRLLARPK